VSEIVGILVPIFKVIIIREVVLILREDFVVREERMVVCQTIATAVRLTWKIDGAGAGNLSDIPPSSSSLYTRVID